ncbi:diacylglycerol/lipid kinase family protein [Lapidilactobacillus wuchangensis]|uniref:diacylglycerol/lipid kinase family protein n=1 Tax=Lapidilactobacillus wuchangensis TaxID=2486001 RepID=UPI0013DE1B08|nr:diacylglycerol kinase family protein [Lapidilactobacillus wuchangensis]
MPKYTIIINPQAGSGAAAKVWPKLKAALTTAQINFDYYFTEYSGHATSLSRKLAQQLTPSQATNDVFLVVGGDGTVNQVLNGIHDVTDRPIPIAYFPAGSGNDFARSLHLKQKISTFIEHLQKIRQASDLNVFAVQIKDETGQTQQQLLINNFGMGFDAHVVHLTEHSPLKAKLNRWHLGNLAYVINLISVLKNQKSFAVDVKTQQQQAHFDQAYLVTLTNIAYFGGGVPIVPTADPHIEELNLIILEKPNLLKFIGLFILMLANGRHLNSPAVHLFKTDQIQISCQPAQYGQMDGEDMGHHAFQLQATNQQYPFWI